MRTAFSTLALSLGFVGPRGHDRDAVMLRHLVIGAIEIRLIAARAVDAGPRIIRHDQLRGSVEKLEGGTWQVDPVRQILARARLAQRCKCWRRAQPRKTKPAWFRRCRDRRSGPWRRPSRRTSFRRACDPAASPRLRFAVPALVQLAETAVAVAVRLRFAILLPEQLQRQMLVTSEAGDGAAAKSTPGRGC